MAKHLKGIQSSQSFVKGLYEGIMSSHGNHTNSGNYQDDLEIFDKNEANVFAEPHIVLKIVTTIFCGHFDFIK